MELPIYQDNLRSSGDWRTGLPQVREEWQKNKIHPERWIKIREQQLLTITDEVLSVNLLAAAEFVSGIATETFPLTVPSLFQINSLLLSAESKFRDTDISPIIPAHDPALAEMLPRLLENALGWFATEGFAEMNPVEQAALVFLRILDLQPFAAANFETAMLAASLQVERAGLPPLVIDTHDERYATVLENAFRMLTQHLVDFFAESLKPVE
jgi:Fic/DOC family